MKIGLFGITGNPSHFGHAKVFERALESCDYVISSLVYQHPFGKKFIDYEHRKSLLQLMMNDYFHDKDLLKRIIFTDLDKEFIERYQETPYSYKLLHELSSRLQRKDSIFNFLSTDKNIEFNLVIGEDNFKENIWKKFYKNEDILKEFGVCVIPEQGMHSTDIRHLFESLPDEENSDKIISAIGLLSYQYCQKHDLFKETKKTLKLGV